MIVVERVLFWAYFDVKQASFARSRVVSSGMPHAARELVSEKRPVVTPFLRWAGSKRKLLPKLAPYWRTEHKRYLEPFAGSSALFFAIAPAQALLSDTNAELIEVLQVVRETPEKVHVGLSRVPRGKEEYLRLRALEQASLSSIERVTRFIYLNRFCFNGLYRTNLAGKFNVPYAPLGTGEIPPLEQFIRNATVLQNARLRVGDFEAVIKEEVKAMDFVYLDPPYAVENRRIFRQYGPHTFGLEDLDRLDKLLRHIDDIGATFLLSYADCKESRNLAKNWRSRRVYTQRNIAGFHLHRRRAAEVFITNQQD